MAKSQAILTPSDTATDDAVADAFLHLDEVVTTTEDAANEIMAVAEELMELKGGENLATRLFEASTFQDICGQRIRKAQTALKGLQSGPNTAASSEARPDAELLEGPQHIDRANSQDDIDALFDELD